MPSQQSPLPREHVGHKDRIQSNLRQSTYARIMRAAADLLQREGVTGATVEAIAAQAKVSKTTLYKRWPNRTAILIEAFAAHMSREVVTPDTGSAVDDIVQQLREVVSFLAGPEGRILTALIAESQQQFASRDLRDLFFNPRRQVVRELWQRGVAQGLFRNDLDADLAIDLIYGPVIYRLVSDSTLLAPDELPHYVKILLTGLGALSTVRVPRTGTVSRKGGSSLSPTS